MSYDEVLKLALDGEHLRALKICQSKVQNMSESSSDRIVYSGLGFALSLEHSDVVRARFFLVESARLGEIPETVNASVLYTYLSQNVSTSILRSLVKMVSRSPKSAFIIQDLIDSRNGKLGIFRLMRDRSFPKSARESSTEILVGLSPGIEEHGLAIAEQILLESGNVKLFESRELSNPIKSICETRFEIVSSIPVQYAAIHMPDPYQDSGGHEMLNPWRYLTRKSHLSYSGYGLNIVEVPPEQIYAFYKRCRYLMTANQADREILISMGCNKKDVRWTGDPLLWKLKMEIADLDYRADNLLNHTLLWAPHWSQSWWESHTGFSTFHETIHVMVKIADEFPQLKIVLRPHPILRDSLEKLDKRVTIDVSTFEAWGQLISKPNVSLSNQSMLNDVKESSLLITDGISIIGYAAAIGIPIFLTRKVNSPKFSTYGQMLAEHFPESDNELYLQQWLRKELSNSPRVDFRAAELIQESFPLRVNSPGLELMQWVGNYS